MDESYATRMFEREMNERYKQMGSMRGFHGNTPFVPVKPVRQGWIDWLKEGFGIGSIRSNRSTSENQAGPSRPARPAYPGIPGRPPSPHISFADGTNIDGPGHAPWQLCHRSQRLRGMKPQAPRVAIKASPRKLPPNPWIAPHQHVYGECERCGDRINYRNRVPKGPKPAKLPLPKEYFKINKYRKPIPRELVNV